jgi:hypothetical protein
LSTRGEVVDFEVVRRAPEDRPLAPVVRRRVPVVRRAPLDDRLPPDRVDRLPDPVRLGWVMGYLALSGIDAAAAI